MTAAEAIIEMLCAHCEGVFIAERVWGTTFCSDECRRARRIDRERARDERRGSRPARILQTRDRCARWHEARGGKPGSQPWLAGAPPFDTHLPGGAMSIAIEPKPRWPIALRNTRGLHGAMTAALGIGHVPRWPTFALRMTDLSPSGWAVYWWHEAGAKLAMTTFEGHLYGKPATFTFGQLFRLRAPLVKRRGRRRLRIDTITPVCVVNTGRTTEHVKPTQGNLLGTLGGEWLHRFGLQYIKERDLLRLEVVDVQREQAARVELGGKFGTVSGWEGSLVVETNAVGHWLLETAARVGMGSRTAFGFGQVRVTEVER